MHDAHTPLFISGMRRSGTTIVLDTLLSAGDAHGIYEPLAAARRPSLGGGSGMRERDYFEPVRHGRMAFLEQYPHMKYEDFNYGAPNRPELEYETEFPDILVDYLKSLADPMRPNVYKFTRMHHKLGHLCRLSSRAALVLVVRDPRAVVTSYLYGKGQKHADQFKQPQFFFERRSNYSAWSSSAFFQHLLKNPANQRWESCTDFFQILLLWWDNVQASITAAETHFGDRWFLLRHHEFCRNPRDQLTALAAATGFEIAPACAAWAEANVRKRLDIHLPESENWQRAFQDLQMQSFLDRYQLLNAS